MNRAQGTVLLIAGTAAALILLFPAWHTRNFDVSIDLGRSWFLSPPARVGPAAFRLMQPTADFDESLRRQMPGLMASMYADPEIDWFQQWYLLALVLIQAGAYAFAFRGRRRRARTSHHEPAAAPRGPPTQ